MLGSATRPAMTVLAIALLTAAGRPIDGDPSCRPAIDLHPQAKGGSTSQIGSPLARSGELLRWEAGPGDTLRLKFFVGEPGTYTVTLLAVYGPDAPRISAALWDDPLARQGEERIRLQRETEPEVRPVRFDGVSLGPGHHFLELTCHDPGALDLDCLALLRTGEPTAPGRARDSDVAETPFLGVEMGRSSSGGVRVARTIPGTAAAEAGLESGDVIVRVDGKPVGAAVDLSDAILAHRPGDRVDLALIRDGERRELTATLGRRADSEEGHGSRAAHVIDVLDVRPGQVIADIGAGSGWLSEAIADALGSEGLVYAVEIQERHVRRLRQRSSPMVVPVLSLPDNVSLPADSLDIAMMHDVASHVDRSARPRFYESVARALKPDGRMVIFGPHGRARSMLDELRRYGFVPVDDEPDGDLDQWLQDGIVFWYAPPDP